VVLTGCTTITFQVPRAIFVSDANVSTVCDTYGNRDALAHGIKTRSEAGWRVMQTGIDTTTFLFMSSTDTVVCYEKTRPAAPAVPAAPLVHAPEAPRSAPPTQPLLQPRPSDGQR
jgi:hypothetical protein